MIIFEYIYYLSAYKINFKDWLINIVKSRSNDSADVTTNRSTDCFNETHPKCKFKQTPMQIYLNCISLKCAYILIKFAPTVSDWSIYIIDKLFSRVNYPNSDMCVDYMCICHIRMFV